MKITTTCKTKKSIFRFSKMALNHVLIAPEYSRRRELSKSYLNIFYLPIFDRFVAHQSSKKNFGPNVIYCFFEKCGSTRADEVYLARSLRSTSPGVSGRLWRCMAGLQASRFRSTSPGVSGPPRRHGYCFQHIRNGTSPHGPSHYICHQPCDQ